MMMWPLYPQSTQNALGSALRRTAFMANELIELTQVKITSGKMTGGFKKLIASEYIFSIEPGAQDTALITLANGEKIVVKESYNELKARFGVIGR
jgi:uncharacterized protein YlzI (FlbEa/FlbD family)